MDARGCAGGRVRGARGLAAWQGLNTAPVPGTDQSEYDAYAWNLAQGNGYRGPSPDVADQNHLTAYRPPLPSMVMAAVYLVAGHNYAAVRLLHCLFATGSVLLTYRIGRRAYGETVGLLAAAGYAIYPLAISQSADLLSEPLGVCLFLLFLDLALVAGERSSWPCILGAGLVFGLALLARANYVLMIPPFIIWILWQTRGDRRMLGRWAMGLALTGMVLLPWVVRNYLVFDRLIPFSTMGGSVLLQGNNRLVVTKPKYFGYSVWDTELDEYRESLHSAGNEYERDARAKQFAIQWLKENKDKWGFLVWHKFARSWTPFLVDNPSAAHRAIYLATWGPVLVLFALAFFPTLIASLRQRSPAWLLHLAILSYVANSVIFFANIRYRSPVAPICFILACWMLMRIVRTFRPLAPTSPGTSGIQPGE